MPFEAFLLLLLAAYRSVCPLCQSDKLRIQREAEEKLEQTTSRYEERITELHSVIAELRKKLDRNQINVIR